MIHKHTISILVADHPGVLQRVSGMYGRRGFNIESITVGSSEEQGLSRMVIVCTGDDKLLAQISAQLMKLIDVVRVERLSSSPMVARELAFIKVSADSDARPKIIEIVESSKASIVDIGAKTVIIQVVEETDRIDEIVDTLLPYGIVELTRTGVTAMSRGA